ncbi:hypothetical protein PybrP1_012720, partial [[Pythium] brassicae (nom. inval.)]
MRLVPLEEDSLVFQFCFYYGLLVVFLEVVVPLVCQRRLRLVLPAAVRLPLAPPLLSAAAFTQQKTRLGARIHELQRASSTAKKTRRKSSVRAYSRTRGENVCVGLMNCLRVRCSGLALVQVPSATKATPSEKSAVRRVSASERRVSEQSAVVSGERRARSTGKAKAKRTTASSSDSISCNSTVLRLQALRRLRDELDKQSAVIDDALLSRTPRSLNGSSSLVETSVETTTASSVSRQSPERVRSSPAKSPSSGTAGAASLSRTQQRHVRREQRRSSWHRAEEEEEEETKDGSAFG